MGEKFGRDSIWEIHLAEELWQTEIELEAVLDQQYLSLYSVLNMEVGTRLMFNATPDSRVVMRCGDVPMWAGRMGRKGNNIAICLDEKVKRKRN
jgi:flagellar motor switch protein FliM